MTELNKGEEQFIKRWEKHRDKKWQYVFLHGSVYKGLTVATATFFVLNIIGDEEMSLLKFLIYAILWMIGGLLTENWNFKQTDGIYLALNDDDEIAEGIQIIRSGNIWNYENLQIHKEQDDTLIIRNELFWFEEKELSSEKLNECFNLVSGDCHRLQQNTDFVEYTRNFKVNIQIVDNSGNNIPLIEKEI